MRNKASPYYQLLNEAIEEVEDEGDVSSFDSPIGTVGQRIIVDVPEGDPGADLLYGTSHNGKTGEIIEEIDRSTGLTFDEISEGSSWFMIILDDGERVLLPRHWFKPVEDKGDVSQFEVPIQAAREDMYGSPEEPEGLERGPRFDESIEDDDEEGDVSAFEAPTLPTYRGEVRVKDIADAYRAEHTDEDIRSFTTRYLLDHISMDDFIEYRRNRDELKQLFKDVTREIKLHESVEDPIGKVVEWTTLRGETHRGPVVELDGNVAYVDCEICGKQIAVEDGAYDFEDSGSIDDFIMPDNRCEECDKLATEVSPGTWECADCGTQWGPAVDQWRRDNFRESDEEEDEGDVSAFTPTYDEEIYEQALTYLTNRYPDAFAADNYKVSKDTSEMRLGDRFAHQLSLSIKFKKPINNKGVNRFLLQQDLHDPNAFRLIAQRFSTTGFQSGKEVGKFRYDPDARKLRVLSLRENAKSKLQVTDPKFMKAFYDVYLKDSRYNLKDLEGFPEGLDLENCDIVCIGNDFIQFEAGGDWQNPVSFSLVVSAQGEPRIAGLYESISKSPKKKISAYIKRVEALMGAKKESRMTYKDILYETRRRENAEDIAQDLSQMQGRPVESEIPPPPDAAPAPAPTPQAQPNNQEQQVQVLFTKYYPTMGTPGAVQQISKDLSLPYAAAHAMVSHYLSQFTESSPYDRDWSIPLPGGKVDLISTEMAPLDKPGVDILAGNAPDIHADSEFDLPEYNKMGVYHKRRPYGESVEEDEGHGDVSAFPEPHYASGDRITINIPQDEYPDLDAETQRLNGREAVIQEYESAEESATGEEQVLVLLVESNGQFEWIPVRWAHFMDPEPDLLEESVEEEDFGDVANYEEPGWRTYFVDYVVYGHNGNEYHHAKFAAPDDERALEFVAEEFTGQAFAEIVADFETDDVKDILSNFSNSDMDIIEIYSADSEALLYAGAGAVDGFDDAEDTMEDEDWDE